MEAVEPRTGDYLDLTATIAASLFDVAGYPWLALGRIDAFVAALLAEPPAGYRRLSEKVLAGEGCSISPRAEIIGPAIIGPGAEIRTGAFIRENVVIGAACVVGNSSEIKNSILFDGAQAPHFNYVGDSILGRKAHLGAGVILSNFKFAGGEVSVRPATGAAIATGLVKFGAIVGDDAELGCNSVCFPGALVGRGALVYPLCRVRGTLPAGCIQKAEGIFERKSSRKPF